MKRFLISSIFMMIISISSFASDKSRQYSHFHRGSFFSVDLSAGSTFNERINMSYGMDMAAGYRFRPQLVIAAGFGAHAYFAKTSTVSGGELRSNQTTSVPVFLRLRSDFLDRKVSPYVQLDLGYSFVFLYSHDAGHKIKYNDNVFMDKVEAMGFSSLEDYEAFFRTGLPQESADALWGAELSRLKQFTNGSHEYITMDGVHMQYGKNGLFANLDLGVSWKVGENRMNAGISAGLSQSYYGTCLRTSENEFVHFGRTDFLPYEKGQQKVLVNTVGQEDFSDSFEIDLRIKIGFSF